MSKALVERKLAQTSSRLKDLRAELVVVNEQLAFFAEAADETRLRALMSETPIADREHQEAQRHADAMRRHHTAVVAAIAELERSQDELLERLMSETR